MWICPNCETANNSRKKKCAVCDTEKPFSNENPNSPSILKSKIQDLEEQVLGLNSEKNLLITKSIELQKKLDRANDSLSTVAKQKEDLKKELDIVKLDKTLLENRLERIEKEKSNLSISLDSTKVELENIIQQKAILEQKKGESAFLNKKEEAEASLGVIVIGGLLLSLITYFTPLQDFVSMLFFRVEDIIKYTSQKNFQMIELYFSQTPSPYNQFGEIGWYTFSLILLLFLCLDFLHLSMTFIRIPVWAYIAVGVISLIIGYFTCIPLGYIALITGYIFLILARTIYAIFFLMSQD